MTAAMKAIRMMNMGVSLCWGDEELVEVRFVRHCFRCCECKLDEHGVGPDLVFLCKVRCR